MKYQLCPNSTKIYAFEEKSTHMSEPYLSLSALTHNTTKFKVKIVLATYPTIVTPNHWLVAQLMNISNNMP